MVIELLAAFENDTDRVLQSYGETLKRADIEAALWYYHLNKDAIDRKLREEQA